MNELNYPIKYAILGIEEQVGWLPGLHEMEREYDICGYIVSKVYVVEESIRYYGDGSYQKYYQVVFPFTSMYEKKRQIPSFNLNWNCYNYVNVSKIFDTFDDAKMVSNEKNKELRAKSYLPISYGSNMSWKERVLKGKELFDKRMVSYLEFEEFISNETKDMEITTDEKMKNKVRKL